MQNDKFLKMLGLAMRARKLSFGEAAVKDGMRGKTAKMVILATDASDNTRKKLTDSCRFYQVPCLEYGDRYALGSATGRELAVAISVNDESFAKALTDILQN